MAYTSLTRAVCENCRQESRGIVTVRVEDPETGERVGRDLCPECAAEVKQQAAARPLS